MGGVGIVNNPRSARNRRHPATGAGLARLLGSDGLVADASTPDELQRALETFRAAGVDTLGVNGGDGTNHYVLTAAAAAWGAEPLPDFLVLRGGTMNTLASNHGLRGEPEAILAAHLAGRRAGRPAAAVERDLLRVEGEGLPPTLGFLFGTGLTVRFLEAYYRAAHPSALTAALLLLRAAASALVNGPFSRTLTRREPLRVTADGDDWPDASYLTLVAGTIPSLGLGFKALARCDEQPGFFHAVGVHGTPGQVAWLLPRVHRGAPWRRRAALDAVARVVTLEGEGLRFFVDGDLYGPVGAVRLETGPAIRILVPPRPAPGRV
jgi:diacylglycerol kinase (ATP)